MSRKKKEKEKRKQDPTPIALDKGIISWERN